MENINNTWGKKSKSEIKKPKAAARSKSSSYKHKVGTAYTCILSMYFHTAILKSNTHFSRNKSRAAEVTLRRHHTEQVYTRLNTAQSTKMFFVDGAGVAGAKCTAPILLMRCISEVWRDCYKNIFVWKKSVFRDVTAIISVSSYLAEKWRSFSSRSCTAEAPGTLLTGDWHSPLEGAQTGSQH